MAKTRVNYIPGAHKRYTQWNEMNAEIMSNFKWFHKDLREKGYNIRCANVAEKDGELYWILMNASGNYELEHYGTLNPGKKERSRV